MKRKSLSNKERREQARRHVVTVPMNEKEFEKARLVLEATNRHRREVQGLSEPLSMAECMRLLFTRDLYVGEDWGDDEDAELDPRGRYLVVRLSQNEYECFVNVRVEPFNKERRFDEDRPMVLPEGFLQEMVIDWGSASFPVTERELVKDNEKTMNAFVLETQTSTRLRQENMELKAELRLLRERRPELS